MKNETSEVVLTPAQIQNCNNITGHLLSIERYGKMAEADLKDGLNGSEMIELVLQSPTLVTAVKGIIAERKIFRKEDEQTEAAMFVKIGEIIGADNAGAKERVSLTFDYVSKMVGVVTTATNETKIFAAALRGERQPEPKTRKPRTPKA